jgi:hypothetical protein
MTHDENRISDLIDGGLHEKSAIDKAKYELHMRRIAAIDEAATKAWEDDVKHNPNPNNPYAYRYGFKQGAKEVIEHPERYSLVSISPEEKQELHDILCGAAANVRYYNDKDKEIHDVIQGLIKKFKP